MPKSSQSKTPITVRLPIELEEKMTEICAFLGWSKQQLNGRVLERVLPDLWDAMEAQDANELRRLLTEGRLVVSGDEDE